MGYNFTRYSKKLKSSTLLLLALLVWGTSLSKAAVRDSLHTKQLIKQSVVPLSLIVSGSILSNRKFEKNIQTHLQNALGENFEFNIDDYTQYIPVAELYLADICGVKSKNHWFDQTKYLAISNIIAAGLTHGLKRTVNKSRPNGSPHAFPSGHTTLAFTNATVLYTEFNETAPILAYSGYLFASTTGVFRVINNEHWISDVLVGAGIGILCTNLVYYIEPLKNFNPFKKSKNIGFSPYINQNNYGFYFSYRIPDKL